MKLKLFLGLIIWMALASCHKENPDTASMELPVVEGYLVIGHAVSVKVYQQKSLDDTAKYGEPITGLKLYVSDGITNVLLNETTAGIYTYNDTSFLETGKTYSLQFKYLTYIVSAKTIMPARPVNFAVSDTIADLSAATGNDTVGTFYWSNPDLLYHVLVFIDLDGKDFPKNFFGNIGNSNFEIDAERASYYQMTPNIFSYEGEYEVILMSVNQEYINLLKSNTSNSTSQNLTGVTTNINNGFGIFTAMQGDTLNIHTY